MIIVGNKYIKCDNFEFVESIDEIKYTSSNSTIIFNYNLEIMDYCYQNKISYAIFISSIKEAVFGNSLMAKYLIGSESNANEIQKIAECYMFDSKILVPITDESMIENIAKCGIDGVIYNNFLEGLRK
ncbi:MAG: hypothetical protein L0Y61_00650 [Epsilonproteobacteria bacterium]|nr:hypothetical protein [Campylobacterota bacterium]